ncbi:unnamed protein product [Arctia plantaginis]|uniref:RPGRIP1 C-terminal domain-containing protein n=1 Tax=Arctia plantaginis TaxID=874455 RepID=A0A8S0ZH73_ARCPL|nr:unnamed protein product [Arctia plantaginis]
MGEVIPAGYVDIAKSVQHNGSVYIVESYRDKPEEEEVSIDITILWLALNEECEAMLNPRVQRVYVSYEFLGYSGADLETPVSLPKPKHYVDKCYFNFKKSKF